jgi:uncharacterized protein (TIGR02271 family)
MPNDSQDGRPKPVEESKIPVAEETVEIEKRTRATGAVRAVKRVRETHESVEVILSSDDIHVERVTHNRPVTEPLPIREEGDTVIIPVLEEVVVVEKRLVLKEEWRLSRRRSERKAVHSVALRSEEVVIEREKKCD